MESSLLNSGNPDELGMAIAQAVQDEMPESIVILFGSRARGDHRADSDTDLLIIIPDNANRVDWQTQARWKAARERERLGTRTGCDVSVMTKTEYERNRKANNHIAGQADAYGVNMRERNDYSYRSEEDEEDEDYIEGHDAETEEEATAERIQAAYAEEHTDGRATNYPDHWPETRVRIENALEWLDEVNERVENNRPRQRLLGFAAQQSLENGLKAWLSSYNDNREWGHEFGTLWTDIKGLERNQEPPASSFRNAEQKVESLLDATSYTDSRDPTRTQNWLELYAVNYGYGGTSHVMTPDEKADLRERLNEAINAIVEHVHWRSGTAPDDVPR